MQCPECGQFGIKKTNGASLPFCAWTNRTITPGHVTMERAVRRVYPYASDKSANICKSAWKIGRYQPDEAEDVPDVGL